MTAKKPEADTSPNEEQADMKKIEEKIKRMLDPSVPDTPEKSSDNKASEPSTAPELNGSNEDIALPTEIKIMSGDEKVESAETKKAKSISIKVDGDESATDKVTVREGSKDSDKTHADSDVIDEPQKELPDEAKAPAEAVDSDAASTGVDDTDGVAAPKSETETSETDAEKSEDTKQESSPVADHVTDKAVDDIIASESDELLEVEDEKRRQASEIPKKSFFARLKHLPAAWWHNRLARRATFIVLFLGLVAGMIIPVSRYFILNSVGVRSGASVKIIDDSTQQPLKNVTVSLRGQEATTDTEGVARFSKLKLGRTELVVQKRAFAPLRRSVTLGWGSNPLNAVNITPVDSQYVFRIKDFLSTKPLSKIEAVSGDASAYSDEEGLLKLTVDKTDDAPLEVSIVGEGLRTEVMNIDANDTAERTIEMVPARKHVFITKQSGKYDVYKMYVDGKDEELMVAGSGHEKSDMVLVPHPDKDFAALVSTRTGARNSQGFLMSTLLLIDLSDNSTVEVALSERIQVLGWQGNKLVYVRIIAGTSAAIPDRHRLMTYDLDTFESQEIAKSNFFNDLVIAKSRIYFAPSSAYQTDPVALFSVKADGSERQKVLDKETWSLFRTAYNSLTLAVGQDWYEYNLANSQVTKLGGEPANLRDRAYVDSPDGKRSLWADVRDGKSILLAYDTAANSDTQIFEQSGLKTPIRWLNNNSIVYRVTTAQETADYALSLDGGDPKKIRDVTDTAGVDSWYYY